MKCEGLSIIAMASHSVTRLAVLSCLFFSSLNAEKVDANDIFSERCPKSVLESVLASCSIQFDSKKFEK